MAEFFWCLDAPPPSEDLLVERSTVARYRNHTLTLGKYLRQFTMGVVGHFIAVGLAVSPTLMWIRGITIKQCVFAIVALDHFGGGSRLELDPQETLSDQRKILYGTEPPGNRACHTRTTSQRTVRPPSDAGSLSQPCSDLPSAHKKTSCAFQVRLAIRRLFDSGFEFRFRERRQTNRLDKT